MDPSVMLILSNLLHLHNHLDPSSSLLTSPSPSPPSSSPSPHPSSSSAAPLLFFALASALSLAQPQPPPPSPGKKRPPRPRVPRPFPPSSSASLLLSLTSSDRVWSMPPALRDSRFRSLLGLSYPLFATLLDHLRDHPNLHSPTPAATSLSLDQSLSLALSRLSRGLSSRSLSRLVSLPPSLISRSTHSLTRLLSTRLYSHYVKPPLSSHRLLSTLSSFHDLSSLPSLAGALCSSPVRLRQNNNNNNNNNMLLSSSNTNSSDVSLFSPQRPFPSILLQAVADPRRIFWDACVRAPGGSDPASHLRDSSLYRRLSDPADPLLKEPPPTASVRPYIAGDVSFPLLPFLLTPFASRDPSPAQEAFDAALGKARASSVEPAVALLKGRWKILRNLNVGLDHAAQTVVACVVLHNMCQIAGEPEDEGRYFWRDPPETQQPARPVESERSMYYQGESLRQALADDLYERQQRLSGGTGR